MHVVPPVVRWAATTLIVSVALYTAMTPCLGRAQASKPAAATNNAGLSEAERKFAEANAAPVDKADEETLTAQPAALPETPNLLKLWFSGGPLMYPITLMSFLVVVFATERLLGLRRAKVIPPRFVEGLAQLGSKPGGLDPRQAYHLCQQFPSAAANVVRAVLLKVGRPHSELEHALSEASEREAAKLYKNVRTINLAVSVTPLIGLLGTVQGMIECFYTTANLQVGQDKSQALANGIYVALLTTFGGLVVAIPAAVLAHWFEGRIQGRFREIDELMQGLLPQLERYEGKLRLTAKSGSAPPPAVPDAPDPAPRARAEVTH